MVYQIKREAQYEYIHEFKERINEILWLVQKHHDLINNNKDNPQIQQTSLAELHRLNITLSNYFDVAPSIVNGITLSTPSESKSVTKATTTTESEGTSITGLYLRDKPFWIWDKEQHLQTGFRN